MAIGDYIHYHPNLYLERGNNDFDTKINTKELALYSFADQRRSIKQRMKSINQDYDLQDIENQLNYFFGGSITKERAEIMEKVAQIIMDEFSIAEKDFNKRMGQITKSGTQQTNNLIQDVNKKFYELKEGQKQNKSAILLDKIEESNTYIQTIYGRVELIDAALKTVTDEKEKKRLEEKINVLHKLLYDLFGSKQDIYDTYGTKSRNHLIQYNYLKNHTSTIKGYEEYNVITLINSLLEDNVLLPVTQAAKAQGTFFEYMIAVALAQTENGMYKSIDEALENVTSKQNGGNKKKMILEKKFLDNDDIVWETFSNSFGSGYEKGIDYVQSTVASENKIDVEITYKDRTLPISAKSYALAAKRNISLVSGTNLLYMLQEENNTYVNHYLNVINANALHSNYASGFRELREQGYLATAYTVLYKAFTGDVGDRARAEIFVINDVTGDQNGNRVKVYSIGQLLEKILNNAETVNGYSSITANNESLSNLSIENKWVGRIENTNGHFGKPSKDNAKIRIGNYLANVAHVKLHASLKQNVFNLTK